ncbi:hypothetical protein GE09DRAFT_254910 [Coniochaeta sp. 2T2.1]|nr:hypothetical protein GE09DRAFT_254910 [Coniochaeta sp. 2T2.1]
MDEMRRRTNRTDSGWSSTSSKSSSSIPSVFRTRSVPSWEKQAIEEERAARPLAYQWKCPRYNLTWAELEQHLRRRFPNETFYEFQVSLCCCWFLVLLGKEMVRNLVGTATYTQSFVVGGLLDLQCAREANTKRPRGIRQTSTASATAASSASSATSAAKEEGKVTGVVGLCEWNEH